MRVAIQASHLAGEVRGIGRYVWALLPRLAALRPELRFTLHIKNPRDEARLEPRLDAIAALDGRVQFAPLSDLPKTRADVAWYPWNVAKPLARYAPIIVTMHDIANVAMPDPRFTAAWKNLRWRLLYNRTAKRATLILADSEFTAREIERVLHVGAETVRVVRLAADDFSVANGEDPQPLFTRLGVTQPYVLTAGAKDRRKNLALVERAMSRLNAAGCSATLMNREKEWALVTMPSGEVRRISAKCRATIGSVSNPDHMNISLGKAGRKRWMGRKPHNRGMAMNPTDHPLGGGEGRAKGGKTRSKKKPSNSSIVRRRPSGRFQQHNG